MSIQYKRVKQTDGTYRHQIVRENPHAGKALKVKKTPGKVAEGAGAKK